MDFLFILPVLNQSTKSNEIKDGLQYKRITYCPETKIQASTRT